jgi:hypothetical protein
MYIAGNIYRTVLADTIINYITSHLDNQAFMDSIIQYISRNNEYLEQMMNSMATHVHTPILGDTLISYVTRNLNTGELGESIVRYITHHFESSGLGDTVVQYLVNHPVFPETLVNLVHENERDRIIGNEITNATTNGGLIRSGSGTSASPYTLGIASGGVTATHPAVIDLLQ